MAHNDKSLYCPNGRYRFMQLRNILNFCEDSQNNAYVSHIFTGFAMLVPIWSMSFGNNSLFLQAIT